VLSLDDLLAAPDLGYKRANEADGQVPCEPAFTEPPRLYSSTLESASGPSTPWRRGREDV